MGKVLVSRQHVDSENKISWVHLEVEEDELLEGEAPV